MQLSIEEQRMIKEVQAEFSAAYPFLKLEFYKNGNTHEKKNVLQKKVEGNIQLGEIMPFKKSEGHLSIADKMTVADIENAFQEQFGLTVELFRRSGNVWLETTMTDNWTLKQQNEHGQEITLGKKLPATYGSTEDYELNRDADH